MPKGKRPTFKKKRAKYLKLVVESAKKNDIGAFNHAGDDIPGAIMRLAAGNNISAEQFRDRPRVSPEIHPGRSAGRHEIVATAERNSLAGNSVATFAAHAARTSTSLAFLNGPKNEVVIHSNSLVSGKSTKGQAAAHGPFHALAPELANETDPYVVSAMIMQTALKGLTRARHIRQDPTLTGSVAMIGDGPLERPNPSRGHDDGYESDTERGRLTRRVAAAERQLKNALYSVREESSEARKRTLPPSPTPTLGGMGSVPFEKLKLSVGKKRKKRKKLSDADLAHQITTSAFVLYQTSKES